MMPRTPPIALLALLLSTPIAGCGGGGRDTNDSLYGNDGLDSLGESNDELETGQDPTGAEGPDKLDTLSDEEGMATAGSEEGNGEGCQAIDFLFVIDNSGSMGDNQQNLINSFPGFIQKIQETIVDVDSYHIMVVKTDERWTGCDVAQCSFFPFLCTFGDINACDGAPSVCDDTLGAGVNFPVGNDASNQYCQLAGGQRYLTPQEPVVMLPGKFTCIASVGTDGDSGEQPMAALTAAISDGLNGPGGCNSGFLRDDAVLVVTIITDEEDSNSPGTADGWYQSVIAQKSNEGVVVLGLLDDATVGNPNCVGDPAKIREFIQKFPNKIVGSVCENDYSPFFEDAVDLINTTCDEYVPVG